MIALEKGVTCKICGYQAKKSIQAHLNRFHGISKDTYLIKYPEAPILSDLKKDLKACVNKIKEVLVKYQRNKLWL